MKICQKCILVGADVCLTSLGKRTFLLRCELSKVGFNMIGQSGLKRDCSGLACGRSESLPWISAMVYKLIVRKGPKDEMKHTCKAKLRSADAKSTKKILLHAMWSEPEALENNALSTLWGIESNTDLMILLVKGEWECPLKLVVIWITYYPTGHEVRHPYPKPGTLGIALEVKRWRGKEDVALEAVLRKWGLVKVSSWVGLVTIDQDCMLINLSEGILVKP